MELFLAFLVKHFFVDLPMQLYRPQLDKSRYLGPGHQHYFEHGLLTFAILVPYDWPVTIGFAIADYIIHWHIDWIKSCMRKKYRIPWHSMDNTLLNIADQGAHLYTYAMFSLLLM